jgi:hypothetical protein
MWLLLWSTVFRSSGTRKKKTQPSSKAPELVADLLLLLQVGRAQSPRSCARKSILRSRIVCSPLDPMFSLFRSYKLVTVEFPYFGLQGKVENLIQSYQRSLFNASHRQLFCWIDEWFGKTMEDIRTMERETKALLDAKVPQLCRLNSPFFAAFNPALLHF